MTTTSQLPLLAEGLEPDAAFRRAHGIPPHGDTSAPDSEWGFPVPDADHPQAKAYAHGVLSRAHQNGNFKPEDVAKQVAKARKILGKTKEAASELKPLGIFALREVTKSKDGTAQVIIIREGPGNLGDRHWYTASTLAESVTNGVWEGAQCYTDHPTPTEDREQPGRSVNGLAGWYSDAKLVDYTDPERGACKAIESTFHPQIGRDDIIGMMQTQVEYAKRFPKKSYFGLSINAAGDGEPAQIDGEDWNRVDSITEVGSIDFVTCAGAGGKILTFKESYQMARETQTIDKPTFAKLKEQLVADIPSAVRRALKESAIELTPQQDQALDAQLGLVDGGLLDRAMDQATGVSPQDDEDDNEMTEAEKEAKEKKEAAEREKREREAAGDRTPPATPFSESDEDMAEADKDIKEMSAEDLKKFAAQAKAKEKREKREADEKEAREKREAEEKAAKEKRESAATLAGAQRQLKEIRVKTVLEAQNVPENFRPMLSRELMERASLLEESDIAKFSSDWTQAHVTPVLSAGTLRESVGSSAGKIAISFTDDAE